MNNVQPTEKQVKTLLLLAENPHMPMGEAMIQAGYSEKTAEAPSDNFLDRRGTQVAIEQYKELLQKNGITLDYLSKKTAEWLDAKKVVSARITGKAADSQTDDFIEVPDYQTQLRAAEFIREDFGIKQQGKNIGVQINAVIGTKKNEYEL